MNCLPEQERRYLEENLKEDAAGMEGCRIVWMDLADGGEALSAFPAAECIFVSGDERCLREAAACGMATLGYLSPLGDTGARGMATPDCLPLLWETQNGIKPGDEAQDERGDGCADDPEQAADSIKPDMYAEGMEEVDITFLRRVYERHHRLPWTILETERCVVKEFSMEYLDDLFELYAGEGITDYMEPLYDYEKEKEYQQAYIENMYRFFGYGMWIICEKETGKLVGRAGIESREELGGELELGYVIGAPYQNRGYATEVCLAILDYAKTRLKIPRIYCLIEEGNDVSLHLAQKLGFAPVGVMELGGKLMKKFGLEIR